MRKYLMTILSVFLMLFLLTACDEVEEIIGSLDDETVDQLEDVVEDLLDTLDDSDDTMELVDKLLEVIDEADEYVETYCTSKKVYVTAEDWSAYSVTKYFMDTDGDEELDDDEDVVLEHYSGKYVYAYTSPDGKNAVSGTWSWENGTTTDYDGYSSREESRSADMTITLDGTQYKLFLDYSRTRYDFTDGSREYNYTSAYVTVDDVKVDDALDYMNENW